MPNTGFVKKSAVRYFIAALFIFNMLVLAGGLFAVEKYAANQASIKAAALAQKTSAADRYALNHEACAVRRIVAPQLASLDKARKDMTIAASARKRAQVTYIQTRQQLLIWTTVPPGFDCATLPKNPPPE